MTTRKQLKVVINQAQIYLLMHLSLWLNDDIFCALALFNADLLWLYLVPIHLRCLFVS